VHAALELVDIDFFFNGAEEVGEVLVTVAHIPAFVSEALASVIDPGKFFLKLLGVQLPSGLDGGGRKNNGVGKRSGRVSEGGAKEPKVTKTAGAVHEQGRVNYRLDGMSLPRSEPLPRLAAWLPWAALICMRPSPFSLSSWAFALAVGF